MMNGRRGRRGWSNQTLLPLHPTRQLSNTISCWYCDVKFLALNEPLFRLGRRHSRYLRVWFSIGIGFSLAALLGATVILLCQMAQALLVYQGTARLVSSSLFGLSSLIAGLNISLPSFIYLCISSLISVFVHEFGHALAAASEDVHIEYVAVFLAVLFPGALVAFNHASLQALPGVASLRIYCAGIWHNAAFCAVCAFALFLLPCILNPFYSYGEAPMVLDVPPTSPLSGYVSPRDVIISLDDTRIHTIEDWKRMIALLTEQTKLLSSSQSSEIANDNKRYCVPHSLIQESTVAHFKVNETNCPKKLSAFISASCPDPSKYNDNDSNINLQGRGESIQCLDAKDVVKLNKCAHNRVEAPRNGSSCVCSKIESCLTPVQLPGLQWVEITFSSLDCRRNSNAKDSILEEKSCLQTFVFVGDLISMAHSIHLTSYQPRWFTDFAPYLPDILEKLFTCCFHVSMLLALLNSLPVFFLDGESILEGAIHYYFVNLNSRKKRLILRCCLLGGTFISTSFFLQIVFFSIN